MRTHSDNFLGTTARKYDWQTHTWTASSPTDSQGDFAENPRTGYSRGMSWDPSTDSVSWKVSGSSPTDSSWTPTIKVTTTSNMLVDEPNQQGLSNENSASVHGMSQSLCYAICFIMIFYN